MRGRVYAGPSSTQNGLLPCLSPIIYECAVNDGESGWTNVERPARVRVVRDTCQYFRMCKEGRDGDASLRLKVVVAHRLKS